MFIGKYFIDRVICYACLVQTFFCKHCHYFTWYLCRLFTAIQYSMQWYKVINMYS